MSLSSLLLGGEEGFIQKEASNLQSTAKDALLNAILLAAKRHSSGVPRLLTQICLALSALLFHVDPYSKLGHALKTTGIDDQRYWSQIPKENLGPTQLHMFDKYGGLK